MATTPDPITAEVFRHLFISIAEEMGVTLERTAYSPNVKERRDYSCAVFDHQGALVAQAAHIPVHLGAFPLLMKEVVPRFEWSPGDVLICNDPYVGGTHLPDISLVSPVFGSDGCLAGFVANRAHHADVGGTYAGSMGPATELHQEGIIIPPLKLYERGQAREELLELILRNVRTPVERRGDLTAQLAANATGVRRFEHLLQSYGAGEIAAYIHQSRRQTALAVEVLLRTISGGVYEFADALDPEQDGGADVPIRVRLAVSSDTLAADFTGTAPQQPGPINATLAVTHAAVVYALACLFPAETSLNEGVFDRLAIQAPRGTLVHAQAPAAVAAGNVETSQRIVDVVFGALAQALPDRIPAASQGTMNNLTLGGIDPETGAPWAYYETLGGGAGASPWGPGASGVHCHMSNTRNTPAEALEYHYPLRVTRYALRDGSSGEGQHRGGSGVVREVELLGPATATLLTDRRLSRPYGLAGGFAGAPGVNECNREGEWDALPGRGSFLLEAGARLRLQTPGGGGWGAPLTRAAQEQEDVVEGVGPRGDGEAA